jgi:hypothetical protein
MDTYLEFAKATEIKAFQNSTILQDVGNWQRFFASNEALKNAFVRGFDEASKKRVIAILTAVVTLSRVRRLVLVRVDYEYTGKGDGKHLGDFEKRNPTGQKILNAWHIKNGNLRRVEFWSKRLHGEPRLSDDTNTFAWYGHEGKPIRGTKKGDFWKLPNGKNECVIFSFMTVQ